MKAYCLLTLKLPTQYSTLSLFRPALETLGITNTKHSITKLLYNQPIHISK